VNGIEGMAGSGLGCLWSVLCGAFLECRSCFFSDNVSCRPFLIRITRSCSTAYRVAPPGSLSSLLKVFCGLLGSEIMAIPSCESLSNTTPINCSLRRVSGTCTWRLGGAFEGVVAAVPKRWS